MGQSVEANKIYWQIWKERKTKKKESARQKESRNNWKLIIFHVFFCCVVSMVPLRKCVS